MLVDKRMMRAMRKKRSKVREILEICGRDSSIFEEETKQYIRDQTYTVPNVAAIGLHLLAGAFIFAERYYEFLPESIEIGNKEIGHGNLEDYLALGTCAVGCFLLGAIQWAYNIKPNKPFKKVKLEYEERFGNLEKYIPDETS